MRAPRLPLLAIAGLVGLASCGTSEGTPTERLWVSGVPTSPKAPVTAFLTTRTKDGKYIGAFFQGSLLRGGHDVFEWRSEGRNAAKLTFLQDGASTKIRFEKCKPSRGFDYCLMVHGDPTGTVRYQSRKRWATRRPKKAAELGPTLVTDAMAELAEDDEELAAAFASE